MPDITLVFTDEVYPENTEYYEKRNESYHRIAALDDRICSKCKIYPTLHGQYECKECRHIRYISSNEGEITQEKFRLQKYGVTPLMYEVMLLCQGGSCSICGEAFPERSFGHHTEHVDHNNVTGEIRGLLCNGCNRGIGYLNHNVNNLNNAISYLGV